MKKFKGKYRIESNRLNYWDYSNKGFYFITICTVNRDCFFRAIINGIMILSPQSEIVKKKISKMINYNHRVIMNEWVIMPNHIHLLIELTDDDRNNLNNAEDENNGDDVEKIHEFSLSFIV